jgi:aldehyde dehydrogenase (NAD+)
MISKSLKFQKFFTQQLKPKIITDLYINSQFVKAKSGRTFETINPSTNQVIAKMQEADKEDVDLAVKAARKAFDEGPWRKMSGQERGNLMLKLADIMEKNYNELATLESMDNGKPIRDAKAVDIANIIAILRYYAGYADKIHGQTIPVNGPYFVYTRHEPVGVCGQIIPWNFPLLMMFWKLGPVLATGCTTVIKTAEQTPLSALRVAEMINEAGFPEGVVNILSGYGPTAGRALAQHPLVDKVAFTGSTQVGLEIMSTAHVNNLKRITLELGGKSPNVIMDDADVEQAVTIASDGIFYNMGQCCSAGSRVLVHEKIYDKFIETAAKKAKTRKVGNPLEEDTDQGAVVDKEQKAKILDYINKGKAEGAKLLYGGSELDINKGNFIQPTIFTDVKDEMVIAKEEIFGPVMSVLKFKTLDEAIKRANNTSYGLAGAIVTKNMDNALKFANSLRAGHVYVNGYGFTNMYTPFGGFKNSGVGRELGQYVFNNYTEVKTVVIKQPDDALH